MYGRCLVTHCQPRRRYMWTMAEGRAPQANFVALQCSDTRVFHHPHKHNAEPLRILRSGWQCEPHITPRLPIRDLL